MPVPYDGDDNRALPSALGFEAPVLSVVVFEDRAQVVRRGRVEIPAGQITIRVSDVAPVIADRTLQARLIDAPPGFRVCDIRMARDFRSVIDPNEPDASDVEQQLREATAEVEALRYKRSVLSNQLGLVEQMAEKALDDLTADVAWGKATPDAWRQGLTEITAREVALRMELLDLDRQIEDATEKQDDLEQRACVGERPDQRISADLEVEIVAPSPETVVIEIVYVVPVACWRPLHTARLVEQDAGTAAVTFATDGCVWQNTGEDWHNVRLQFSTQRPSLGFEPPLLGEDVLVSREKPETVAVEARDQVISTSGLGSFSRGSEELPGVDDGGVPLTLDAQHTASVPSDGRPYRIKIAEFTSRATTELVAMPELNSSALARVTLDHRGEFPILAGPVELIRDFGIVGRTPVLFVAPGERFRLGFGPDPAIRVTRKATKVPQEPGPLSRFVTTDHSVTLLVCNIGDQTKRIQFTERIPVSEVEQVVIDFRESESNVQSTPDQDGFVKWNTELAPGGRETFVLRYAVNKKKSVEL